MAIRSARYPKYPAETNNRNVRTIGSAKIIAANPVITAMLTIKCPANRPAIYLSPSCQPNAAPTPAKDNTPGPGVMNIKSETIAKASMEHLFNEISRTHNHKR